LEVCLKEVQGQGQDHDQGHDAKIKGKKKAGKPKSKQQAGKCKGKPYAGKCKGKGKQMSDEKRG
jgi:hypothetical protein